MRRLNRSASEGISALRCSKTEAREMPQGPEKERKSSRLSYLIVNPSFWSGCKIGQFNIDSSETEISVKLWFVFISDGYIDKKSLN